jgi:hypothetical protein
MRFLSRVPILLGGLLMAATACGRDTFVVPRLAVPYVDVPVEEPVTEPLQITARESAPPEAG